MRTAAWTLLLVLLWAAPAWAGQATVIARGMAPISDAGQAQARRQARADALRNAVERVMGLRLESRVLIKNELLSSSRLAAFTRGGIKGYRVLAEGPEGYTWRCTLEVTVTDRPADMNCALCGLLGAPSLALKAPAGDDAASTAAARQAVSRVLAGRKLTLLAGPAAAEADIVLTLDRLEVSGGFDGTSDQAEAGVTLTARELSTGQVLASESAQGQALGTDRSQARSRAAAQAAQRASQALVVRLMDWWNHYLHQGLPLRVELETAAGLEDEAELFARAVENLPGVNTCRELWREGKQLKLLASYLGSRRDLQEGILSAWQDQPGLGRLRCKLSKGRVLVFTLM